MRHWRTTLLGALGAGVQALSAIVDLDQLSTKQMVLRFGFAAATFLFGLWAHDPTKSPQMSARPSHD